MRVNEQVAAEQDPTHYCKNNVKALTFILSVKPQRSHNKITTWDNATLFFIIVRYHRHYKK